MGYKGVGVQGETGISASSHKEPSKCPVFAHSTYLFIRIP
jgi:hypothetical protein